MPITVNVAGQVGQIKLSHTKALWPLFETIINSIQSLEDSDVTEKKIVIDALRSEHVQLKADEQGNTVEEFAHFESFVVTDNGNGFNIENYTSFLEAYSQLKVKKGCKGIGRFLWLKAFDKVIINSTYFEDENWHIRSFDFSLVGVSPEKNDKICESKNKSQQTVVKLYGFKDPYRNSVAYSLESLAKKIIEHCLPYFITGKCPQITLKDNRGESFNLNSYYEKTYKDSLHQDPMELRGKQYTLYHMLLTEGADKHELHLCANNREVKSYALSNYIPDMKKKLINGEDAYYYVGYLAGNYLDEAVNTERSDFNFSDGPLFGNTRRITMFPVSEKFKTAIRQNTRKYEWHGTITTKSGKVYNFSSKDIVKGSGYIKWQCCGGSEIELGSVYSAEMGISLFSDIDRYTLNDAQIRIYYSLLLSDGTTETIPMGIFEVSEANRKIKTLEIKAYDYMLRFEKNLKLESSSGTAYQFLKTACDACKVEMAQTVAEIGSFPNGKMTIGIYSDNDIETFRDLIFYVAQVLGCFCQIDRYGRLVLKQYSNKAVWTVPQKERFDSSYSDFVTRYTAVSSTNMITQTSEYIAMETDNALTINLGVNPLMQFGLKSIREKMLREILTALQKVSYVPFDSSTIGNPALEPGDVLKFTGGHADDDKISCITSVEYKINGKQTLKCVGKNPRLANAKSKNDKNITGLLNSIESGKTVIYNFVNVSPFVIGQSLTKVMDIDFTATEETSASFQCEMLLEVLKPENATEDNPELSIVYKINDETIDNFMPTKTCIYGKHIVTLFFPISKVIDNSSNTFSVYLKISDGTVNIGEAQIRATISGQGLAAGLGDWNGRISINENIGFIQLSGVPFMADVFNDRMSVVFPDRKNQSLVQNIENVPIPQHKYSIDGFSERIWFAEILRTFVLESVRGNPKYNGYITINSEEKFVLRKRYSIESVPKSIDRGFAENLRIDTAFLQSADEININGCTVGFRRKFILDTSSSSVKIPSEIDISNGCFELQATAQKTQTALKSEIDEGYLECTTIDISEFDGVKGVKFTL